MVDKVLQNANVTRGGDKPKPKRGLQKGKRGGKREGSGAKRKDVHKHSIVMRVPDALHSTVKAMIQRYNEGNDVITHNIPSKPIAEPMQPNIIEDITVLTYECGCIVDSGLFRRKHGCMVERSKH